MDGFFLNFLPFLSIFFLSGGLSNPHRVVFILHTVTFSTGKGSNYGGGAGGRGSCFFLIKVRVLGWEIEHISSGKAALQPNPRDFTLTSILSPEGVPLT